MAIINRFRYVFTEQGFKHGDVQKIAKKAKVSKATMSKIMNDDRYSPGLETAIRLSKEMGRLVEEIWVVEE